MRGILGHAFSTLGRLPVLFLLALLFLSASVQGACIFIHSDTSGMTLYLDGRKIGVTPILEPVSADSGDHFLSFWNAEMNRMPLRVTHKEYIAEIVSQSTKAFHLSADDTLQITMEWKPVSEKINAWEARKRFATWTAVAFLFVASVVFYTLTGL